MPTHNIALVGEAWGAEEAKEGRPFVGASGYLLNTALAQVGINRNECHVTNVLNFQPQPRNDVINCCGPKSESVPGTPVLIKGKYLRAEFAPELSRLAGELESVRPNLVVALGATAAWALLGTSGIRKIRGAPLWSESHNVKVLPTYHPAAVMREWGLRPILLADLSKAAHEQHFPELRRPQRFVHVEPTLADLYAFEREYITPSPDLSIDIETKGDQITEVGFAPSIDRCIVVPFYARARDDGNYWRTVAEELAAWAWVRHICGLRKRIVGQNFLYDMHFLWRSIGIPVPFASEDTMLLQHAQQPEMEKGLGFLGSIHTNEAVWKFMRTKHETVKRED